MLPALPHELQAQPLGARIAAYTALWTVFCLLLQYGCHALVQLTQQWLGLKQRARGPLVPRHIMLMEAIKSYAVWVLPMAVLQAWLNPAWSDWSYAPPNFLALGYWCQALLMAYDCYSFFLHRWMHQNKAAFNFLHARHHASVAALDVNTSSYMAASEGMLVSGLPFLALFAAGWTTRSWWFCLAGLYNALYIVIMGHCGHELDMVDFLNVGFLVANPFVLWYLTIPCHAVPVDHEIHHRDPRTNFAFFYTYWDDLRGTSKDKSHVPHCTLLVLAGHAVFQALLLSSAYLLLLNPLNALAAYILVYWVVPPATASAVLDALRVPQLTRRVFGRLADAYRRDCCITYEPAGMPGSFELTAAEAVAAAGQGQQQAVPAAAAAGGDRQPVYLFACHPTGLLSRGAFLTFAARGWASPVAGLKSVRLAVGSQLLRLPLPGIREFLLAVGCCPADAATLRQQLQAGTSVALTPGGWRESAHLQTTNLVLQKRLGFVALAAEGLAQLVPVLALGEQDLVGPASLGFRWVKFLASSRPMPVKLVFGQAVAPRQGESVAQLHARYVEALLVLGKQHGVALKVVE